MSPEQCLNQTIDHRSDIYSMGIILYELCTGYTPFAVPGRISKEPLSVMDLLVGHVTASPPSAREISPDRHISEAIDDVLFQSLAKKPQDRFQSVSELQKALHVAHQKTTVTGSYVFSASQDSAPTVTPIPETLVITPGFPGTLALSDHATLVESRSVGELLSQHAPALRRSGYWGMFTFVSVGFVLLVVIGTWWWNPFSFSSSAPRSVDERESGQFGQPSMPRSTPKSSVQRETAKLPAPVPVDKAPPTVPVVHRLTDSQVPPDMRRVLPPRPIVTPRVKRRPVVRRVAVRQRRIIRRSVGLKPSIKRWTPHRFSCPRSGWHYFRVAPFLSKDASVLPKSFERVSKGFCVPRGVRRLRIQQDGFATCLFSIPPGARTHITLRLKRVMQGKMYSPSYCLSVW